MVIYFFWNFAESRNQEYKNREKYESSNLLITVGYQKPNRMLHFLKAWEQCLKNVLFLTKWFRRHFQRSKKPNTTFPNGQRACWKLRKKPRNWKVMMFCWDVKKRKMGKFKISFFIKDLHEFRILILSMKKWFNSIWNISLSNLCSKFVFSLSLEYFCK